MGLYYSDDPASDFARYDADQNKRLAELPVCSDCNEPIQDEFCFVINDEPICPACIETYKRSVDDLI